MIVQLEQQPEVEGVGGEREERADRQSGREW